MKTNINMIYRVLCLALMCLLNLASFAQVQVNESDLLGNWCVEDNWPSAEEEGMKRIRAAKGVITYQAGGIVVCKVNIHMDLPFNAPTDKNNLKVDLGVTFRGNWSIKKGDVLVQKMTEYTVTPMHIVADHEVSDQDKVVLFRLKSMMEETFQKEAKKMTKAGKGKILSFTETEMVINGTVYKRCTE